jgi:hypothetical protein
MASIGHIKQKSSRNAFAGILFCIKAGRFRLICHHKHLTVICPITSRCSYDLLLVGRTINNNVLQSARSGVTKTSNIQGYLIFSSYKISRFKPYLFLLSVCGMTSRIHMPARKLLVCHLQDASFCGINNDIKLWKTENIEFSIVWIQGIIKTVISNCFSCCSLNPHCQSLLL